MLASNIFGILLPPNGSLFPNIWPNLNEFPEETALSHDVCFDGSFEDVNAGAEDIFQADQAGRSFTVGLPGHTYRSVL